MYLLMARAHRYAIDYIEQAPVIVLAAARGRLLDVLLAEALAPAEAREMEATE
jgi:hypothetical protein